MPLILKPTSSDIQESCRTGSVANLRVWQKTGTLPDLSEDQILDCAIFAIEHGHLDVLQWMIMESGYSNDFILPESANSDIDSLTAHAAKYARLDILKWLAFDFTPIASNLCAYDFDTMFLEAISEGHIEIVKWYMTDLFSALHLEPEDERLLNQAAISGQLEILKWLILDSGRYIDLNTDIDDGHVLTVAARRGRLSLVRWLVLESGQAIDVLSDGGDTLEYARARGYVDVAQFLETVMTVQEHCGLDAVPQKMKELEAQKPKTPRRI